MFLREFCTKTEDRGVPGDAATASEGADDLLAQLELPAEAGHRTGSQSESDRRNRGPQNVFEGPTYRGGLGVVAKNTVICGAAGLFFLSDPIVLLIALVLSSVHEVVRQILTRMAVCQIRVDGKTIWSMQGNDSVRIRELLEELIARSEVGKCNCESVEWEVVNSEARPADSKVDYRAYEPFKAELMEYSQARRLLVDEGNTRNDGVHLLREAIALDVVNAFADGRPVFALARRGQRKAEHHISIAFTSLALDRQYREMVAWTDETISYRLQAVTSARELSTVEPGPGLPEGWSHVKRDESDATKRLGEEYGIGHRVLKSDTGFTKSSWASSRNRSWSSWEIVGRWEPGNLRCAFRRKVPKMATWQALCAAGAVLSATIVGQTLEADGGTLIMLLSAGLGTSYVVTGVIVTLKGLVRTMNDDDAEGNERANAAPRETTPRRRRDIETIKEGVTISEDVAILLKGQDIDHQSVVEDLRDLVLERMDLLNVVSARARVLLAVGLGILMIAVLGFIGYFWPQGVTGEEPIFGTEGNLLALSLAGGVLGSTFFAFGAVAETRKILREEFLFFCSYPVLGAGITFIMYTLLRGGVLSVASVSGVEASEVINPYGLVGFSCLVGLFVPKALSKLTKVSDAIFGSDETENRASHR